MICIECKYVSIKPYPSHAKVGLGKCDKKEFATFYALAKQRDCENYSRTTEAKIQKRINWYEQR